jgi:ribonucleoside-diphosphate reductase alpha chain
MTGGGIGVVYSALRGEGSLIRGLGGKSTGPLALMRMVNECSRYIVQGGSRRSAVWAGLHWNHPDIDKFIRLKDWSPAIRKVRSEDHSFGAPMDGTNISVILDSAFFTAYHDKAHKDHALAQKVYWDTVKHMLKTGEPGFSIDVGEHDGEHLRNACTEVTSRDNHDCCNLGSLNLARIRSQEELAEAIDLATAFLLCGTLYSELPLPAMKKVREKNRRIGLGLMGVHEWLLRRGKRYGPDADLEQWLTLYRDLSDSAGVTYSKKLGVARPIATRSIAPTGTISIIGETTSGLEPIYAVAYKRKYLIEQQWYARYVIDPTAQRLIQQGVDPDDVEDAFTLADDVERRIKFQAWVQKHVDHGISSTINLPAWGSPQNNEDKVNFFGKTLLKYLPELRGVTCYPDGARSGQPLVRVPYRKAIQQSDVAFADFGDSCSSGVCSS